MENKTPPNPVKTPYFDFKKLFPHRPGDQVDRLETVVKKEVHPRQLFCRPDNNWTAAGSGGDQSEDPTPLPSTPEFQAFNTEENVVELEEELESNGEVADTVGSPGTSHHKFPQNFVEADSDEDIINENHSHLNPLPDPNATAAYCVDSEGSTWAENRRKRIGRKMKENSKFLPLSVRRRHSGGASQLAQSEWPWWKKDHDGKAVKQRPDGSLTLGAIFLKEDESLDRDKLINVDLLHSEKRQNLLDQIGETENTWLSIREFNMNRTDQVGNAELTDIKPAFDPGSNMYCHHCGESKRREAVERRNPVSVARLPLETQDQKRCISSALIEHIDRVRAKAGVDPFPNRVIPATSEVFQVDENKLREKKVLKLCRAAIALDVEELPNIIVNSPDAFVEEDFHPGVMCVKQLATPGFGYSNYTYIRSLQLAISDLAQTQNGVYLSPDSVFSYCDAVEDLISTRISPRSDGKYQAISFDYPRGTITGMMKGGHNITSCGFRADQLINHVYGQLPAQATPSLTFMQYAADAVLAECHTCKELHPKEWEEARYRLLEGIISLYQNMEKTTDIE